MKMEPIECSETSAFSTQTPGRYPKENLPMNIKPIECSETSAFSTQTPGIYPKENALHIKHGESLKSKINPLKPELNPICYLLALLGAHHFLHVSRIRVKLLTLRRLMSYMYMEHPFLMFLDHTQRRSTVGRTPLDE